MSKPTITPKQKQDAWSKADQVCFQCGRNYGQFNESDPEWARQLDSAFGQCSICGMANYVSDKCNWEKIEPIAGQLT